MTHADAIRLTLLELSALGCMPAKRDVGLFYDERGTPRKIGIPGEADVQAVAPGGRAVAVEVKLGKATPSRDQKRWAARFSQLGGLYVLARFNDHEDGRETIRDAFRLAGLS